MALKDVLIDELRDMYSAENQQVKVLPKLAKGAENAELKQLVKEHVEQTKGQIQRLRQVFEHIGKKPTGKHCEGMEGVLKQASEALDEDADGASFDAGLIGATLRIEHYEVAGYHVVIAMAKAQGMNEVASLLKENLQEEIETGKGIQAAAKEIFKQATREDQEDDKPAAKKSSKDKESAKKSKDDEKQAAPELKKGKKGRSLPKSSEAEAPGSEE